MNEWFASDRGSRASCAQTEASVEINRQKKSNSGATARLCHARKSLADHTLFGNESWETQPNRSVKFGILHRKRKAPRGAQTLHRLGRRSVRHATRRHLAKSFCDAPTSRQSSLGATSTPQFLERPQLRLIDDEDVRRWHFTESSDEGRSTLLLQTACNSVVAEVPPPARDDERISDP